MSKIILGLIALAAIGGYFLTSTTKMSNVEEQFINFVQDYRKSYFSKEDYNFRLTQFNRNLKEIEDLNSNPNDQAIYAVNEFADWTLEER